MVIVELLFFMTIMFLVISIMFLTYLIVKKIITITSLKVGDEVMFHCWDGNHRGTIKSIGVMSVTIRYVDGWKDIHYEKKMKTNIQKIKER